MASNEFDWNLIKSFLAVAEGGSLSAAARALTSSQPTIGRHIGELEQSLKITLFERTANGMALTDAGSQLLENARRIANETASFSLAATGRSQEIAGTVRVTASEIVSHFLLPPIVRRLREAEPQLQIEIVSSNAVQNLLTRDADIAVRMVEPAQAELIARKVNDIALGAFAAPAYLERHGEPKTPQDLLSHTVIGLDRNDLLIREFARMGQSVTRQAFAVRTDDQVLNWRLVEASAGIGFGQLYVGRHSGKVVRILPDMRIGTLPMWVAAHRELRTSLRVRRAYDFIAGALAELPLSDS
jgi:DNA-binding transcriptional LysR family regulator